MSSQPIDFGDTVRVRSTPATQAAGVAGVVGPVYGVTTPSVTGVQVIGQLSEDRAIHVFIEGRMEPLWFAPELLEFIDHRAGAVASIKGVNKQWTRNEDGTWTEEPTGKRVTGLFERFTELIKRVF